MSNDPLNLDEAGEWAGLWWLWDEPDEQVPGILRYDGKGKISLSLIGLFAFEGVGVVGGVGRVVVV